MSKLMKIAAILAFAAIAIGARQFSPSSHVDLSAEAKPAVPAASIVPMDMMCKAGHLPETQIDSLY